MLLFRFPLFLPLSSLLSRPTVTTCSTGRWWSPRSRHAARRGARRKSRCAASCWPWHTSPAFAPSGARRLCDSQPSLLRSRANSARRTRSNACTAPRVTHGALAAPAPWCGALGSPCTCTEVHPGRLAPRCTVHLGASGLLCTCTKVHPGRLAPRCTVHLGASGLLGTLVVL